MEINESINKAAQNVKEFNRIDKACESRVLGHAKTT
jgi:hypothetical protein